MPRFLLVIANNIYLDVEVGDKAFLLLVCFA